MKPFQHSSSQGGFVTIFLMCVLACMLYVSLPFLRAVGPAALQEAQVKLQHAGLGSAAAGKATTDRQWFRLMQAKLTVFSDHCLANNLPAPTDTTEEGLLNYIAQHSDLDTYAFQDKLHVTRASLMWYQSTIHITASQ
jgi:hypothetical protein